MQTTYKGNKDNQKITEEDVNPEGTGVNLYTWYYYDADSNLGSRR